MDRRARLLPLLGMAAGALALGGCVDMFTDNPPGGAARFRGVTSAGATGFPECAPMALDVGVFPERWYVWEQVSGRGHPAAAAEGAKARIVEAVSSWWVEGYANPAGFVQLDLRRQRPIYFRAKPYSVWRGSVDGERMVLEEAGSPCGREVVLAKG
ncbi:MAG TPA: hypothetical protein VFY87_26995 [Geminicoccaceae bacterium]|nr:hypothetical protein [Geminicoccaceae bacterium]